MANNEFKTTVAKGAAWNIVWKHAQVLPMVEFKRLMYSLELDVSGDGLGKVVEQLDGGAFNMRDNPETGEMCARYNHCGCWELTGKRTCCVCGQAK